MRLLLGIPTAGSPAPEFTASLSKLRLPKGIVGFDRHIVTGNFIPAERDLLVERAIAGRADVLIMCDDDMVLPADAFIKLCETLFASDRLAAVGALYYSRDGLRPMAVDGWDPHDTTTAHIPGFDDHTPVEVDGVGFGCVALRVAMLELLERPYFSAHVFVESAQGRVRVCDEDYLLCARLRAHGHTVALHPGVRCGHVDRASQTIAPAVWEPVATSREPRMVALVDGIATLVPVDQSTPHAVEEHLPGRIDYVIVNS